ncbi:hypothetical protein P154DRAFT_564825 [Amniculicola lignicola CBS 123094]|uniref:Methyltransferase domain-containing protein n=1 Tax=Amniculicola lignicola CBS 123094 TaxID=1392246 RepID=A0A6A5W940_9PLEO|nr:hypothetical protein P154DRAFT_564825 [Amniculicola lignicola CBS 123094]
MPSFKVIASGILLTIMYCAFAPLNVFSSSLKLLNARFGAFNESEEKPPPDLAQACRNLLSEVLREAGFDRKMDSTTGSLGVRPTRALLDLGFRCGDQTIYLTRRAPVRETDKDWWDVQRWNPRFDYYTGITLDRTRFLFAQSIFCADASNPKIWDDELQTRIKSTLTAVDERWVLALDTAYHFAPSRWEVIDHAARTLNASFMAFDLCIADNISIRQLVVLRVLTRLLGAPWANFVTTDQYRQKLVEAGYVDIRIRDISTNVFEPLANYLGEQDERLKMVGYGLGSFDAAQWMFRWWGKSGVRGESLWLRRNREYHNN